MTEPPSEAAPPPAIKWVALYTAAVAAACIAVLLYLLGGAPPLGAFDGPGTAAGITYISVIVLTFVTGALGGCLYNLRGLTKHVSTGDFRARYNLSYVIRPLSAGLCGLFVFVLVLGGVMTLTVGNGAGDLGDRAGVMPYVAVAFLAGYGSHEFLKKIKDIIATVFALSEQERRGDRRGPPPRAQRGDDRPADE